MDACQKYQAKVLLDAVAAEDTARSLKAMPNGSTAIVYGRLTETHDPFGGIFPVADVIFRDIKIEGFWLAKYIGDASIWQVYRLSQKVQRLFTSGVFKTDIHKVVDFKDFVDVPVIIKGCAEKPIPPTAFAFLIDKLQPIAKSIMFGEACSTVPLYKAKK